jgi:hypothetical protein
MSPNPEWLLNVCVVRPVVGLMMGKPLEALLRTTNRTWMMRSRRPLRGGKMV